MTESKERTALRAIVTGEGEPLASEDAGVLEAVELKKDYLRLCAERDGLRYALEDAARALEHIVTCTGPRRDAPIDEAVRYVYANASIAEKEARAALLGAATPARVMALEVAARAVVETWKQNDSETLRLAIERLDATLGEP